MKDWPRVVAGFINMFLGILLIGIVLGIQRKAHKTELRATVLYREGKSVIFGLGFIFG
jgi:hypothetical protein